jgi:hypothetical protein
MTVASRLILVVVYLNGGDFSYRVEDFKLTVV